jgi:hypothetical protein
MSTKKASPPSRSFDEMKKELLRDPEIKKAYDADKRRDALTVKRKSTAATKRKTAKAK